MKEDEIIIFAVRLPRELHKRLKLHAVEHGIACQEIVKELIEEYLNIDVNNYMNYPEK